MNTCNPSTEAEAGGLQIPAQSCLHSDNLIQKINKISNFVKLTVTIRQVIQIIIFGNTKLIKNIDILQKILNNF
jgi:hypothetical protein